MTGHDTARLNSQPLNQQAADILSRNRMPWSPEQEVAALALLRQALEKGALETPTIEEPMLLLARLEADPQEAMRLLTESAPGETFEIDLDPDPDQAAAQLLEEIVASLRAQTATPPL
jgi:hypothetical protein